MSVGFPSFLRRLFSSVFSVEGKDCIRKSKDEGERLTRTSCSCLYSSLVAIPVYVKHNISFRDSSSLGRFEITVGPKQTMGKTVEGVMVTSQMPKGVLNMTLTPSQGTHIFDPVTKVRGKREIRFFKKKNLFYLSANGVVHAYMNISLNTAFLKAVSFLGVRTFSGQLYIRSCLNPHNK